MTIESTGTTNEQGATELEVLRAENTRALGMIRELTAELLNASTRERAAKAEAWDEGARVGLVTADWEYDGEESPADEPDGRNPYRAALAGGVADEPTLCEGCKAQGPLEPHRCNDELCACPGVRCGVAAGAPTSSAHATGAVVTERQRCICPDGVCLDHCRACNHSGRDLEEACIADPDWQADEDADEAGR